MPGVPVASLNIRGFNFFLGFFREYKTRAKQLRVTILLNKAGHRSGIRTQASHHTSRTRIRNGGRNKHLQPLKVTNF